MDCNNTKSTHMNMIKHCLECNFNDYGVGIEVISYNDTTERVKILYNNPTIIIPKYSVKKHIPITTPTHIGKTIELYKINCSFLI